MKSHDPLLPPPRFQGHTGETLITQNKNTLTYSSSLSADIHFLSVVAMYNRRIFIYSNILHLSVFFFRAVKSLFPYTFVLFVFIEFPIFTL